VRASFLILMAAAAVLGGALTGCASSPHRFDCYIGLQNDGGVPCAQDTPAHDQDVTAAARAQTQAAADDAKCQSYGAKPGEPAYVQCRMNLDNQRAQAAAQTRAAVAGALISSRPQPQPVPMPAAPVTTNCVGVGNTINCTSR
jgi:hypothetical protein